MYAFLLSNFFTLVDGETSSPSASVTGTPSASQSGSASPSSSSTGTDLLLEPIIVQQNSNTIPNETIIYICAIGIPILCVIAYIVFARRSMYIKSFRQQQ